MIALSAVVAGDESIRRPLAPQPIENLGVLIAAGVVGFLGSELVALPHPGGPPDRLAALVADGLHARTDGFTSLAVWPAPWVSWRDSRWPTRSLVWTSPTPS